MAETLTNFLTIDSDIDSKIIHTNTNYKDYLIFLKVSYQERGHISY